MNAQDRKELAKARDLLNGAQDIIMFLGDALEERVGNMSECFDTNPTMDQLDREMNEAHDIGIKVDALLERLETLTQGGF